MLGAGKGDVDAGLRAVSVGGMAPDFVFDAGSGPRHLTEWNGKPTVVNFWATWCGPCLDELEMFARLIRVYGDRIHVLTLSNERHGIAQRFLDDNKLKVPLAEDPSSTIFKSYTIEEIPVTLVLRRNGTVGYLSVGELEWAPLRSAVEAALRSGS